MGRNRIPLEGPIRRFGQFGGLRGFHRDRNGASMAAARPLRQPTGRGTHDEQCNRTPFLLEGGTRLRSHCGRKRPGRLRSQRTQNRGQRRRRQNRGRQRNGGFCRRRRPNRRDLPEGMGLRDSAGAHRRGFHRRNRRGRPCGGGRRYRRARDRRVRRRGRPERCGGIGL